MNGISTFFQNLMDQFGQLSDRLLSGLSAQTIGLIVLALLVLIVVLIILLAVRGRKYNEAMDLIDTQVDSIVAAKRDAQVAIDQMEQEQKRRESQMIDQINQREQSSNRSIADKERTLAEKNDELLRLRDFHEQYRGVDSAKAEIRRMMDEAHDAIDELKARADREYTEIIGHAQQEAASIREMSQGMMNRSHDMLKKAMERAREIIDEAKAEAAVPARKPPERDLPTLRPQQTEPAQAPAEPQEDPDPTAVEA